MYTRYESKKAHHLIISTYLMNYVVDFEKRRRITNATKSKICSYQTVAYTKSHSQMSLCFNSLISVNVLYMVKLVHVLNIHDIIFVAGHYETDSQSVIYMLFSNYR